MLTCFELKKAFAQHNNRILKIEEDHSESDFKCHNWQKKELEGEMA